MIVGRFREVIPVVEARAVAALWPRPSRVWLRIDPSAEHTLLAADALGLLDGLVLPLDDMERLHVGFCQVTALPQRVLLSFEGDDGRYYQEEVHAYIADGPPGSSRLGADVLSHWLTVLDPGSDSVLCEPLDFEPA